MQTLFQYTVEDTTYRLQVDTTKQIYHFQQRHATKASLLWIRNNTQVHQFLLTYEPIVNYYVELPDYVTEFRRCWTLYCTQQIQAWVDRGFGAAQIPGVVDIIVGYLDYTVPPRKMVIIIDD
jgi:hypothetical protein